MLLISAVLFNVLSPVIEVNAAVSDITDIPEYPSNLKEENYAKDSDFLNGDVIVNEEDNEKLTKIIIPEYSYVKISLKYGGKIYLYGDENFKNEIAKGDYSINVFLPKGEYYLYLNSIEKSSRVNHLNYGRLPIKTLIKGQVKRYKEGYTYYLPGAYLEEHRTAMVTDFDRYYYNVDYSFELTAPEVTSSKECFSKISYTFSVKNKKSNITTNIVGETKNIINIEANGGTYDSNNSIKKDTKKPTVEGIKNGKTYKKSVKFKVSDKSGIKKVTLNKKKISVSKAKKGYRVKKKGKYALKVWDKAGNVRTVKFKIKK